ncbi:MAG: hypothetical protein K6U80_09480 [Firmicutes bacterium]|nr:hypothetical protein [Bacillota bacterium]
MNNNKKYISTWRRLILPGLTVILMFYSQSLAFIQSADYSLMAPDQELANLQALSLPGSGGSPFGQSGEKCVTNNFLLDYVYQLIPHPDSPEIKAFDVDGDGIYDRFEAPAGKLVRWILSLSLIAKADVREIYFCEHISAELAVDNDTAVMTPPNPASQTEPNYKTYRIHSTGNSSSGSTKVEFFINALKKNQRATFRAEFYTRQNPAGQQQYIAAGRYWLNSGAKLGYCGKYATLCKFPVDVKSFLRIRMSNNRYDWQFQKPGAYTTEPVRIEVAASPCDTVQILFSNFHDLKAAPPGFGRISTFYCFGQPASGNQLPPKDGAGWIGAEAMNGMRYSKRGPFEAVLWHKLTIGGDTRAGEYQGTGRITFTVSEVDRYIDYGFLIPDMVQKHP